LIWLKRFFIGLGVVSLLIALIAVFFMGFSKDKPHVLKEHPGAYWRGGADGGQFVEITQAEPTYYFLQIRYGNGELWDEGWLRFGEKTVSR